MTATATPTRTLHEELRARWEAAKEDLHGYDPGSSDDPINDALTTAYMALSAPWYVAISQGTESVDLAADWSETAERLSTEAGRAAFEAHVLPAMIDVLAERFRQYPTWVAAHPDAGGVRADLELLEADR